MFIQSDIPGILLRYTAVFTASMSTVFDTNRIPGTLTRTHLPGYWLAYNARYKNLVTV